MLIAILALLLFSPGVGSGQTLQQQIDDAGSSLTVTGGVWAEIITIAKPSAFTLIGVNNPVICPPLDTTTNYDEAAIRVLSSNVTIRGFTISNQYGAAGLDGYQYAIWDWSWFDGPANISIEDCRIGDIQGGVYLTGPGSRVTGCDFFNLKVFGVYACGYTLQDPPAGFDLVVSNCVFRDWAESSPQGAGVLMDYGGRYGQICYNYFSGMRLGVAMFYGGPYYGNLEIFHNTFDSQYCWSAPVNMTVAFELFSGADEPFWGDAISIRDNLFHRTKWYAMDREGAATSSGTLAVTGNLFYGNYWYYWPDYTFAYNWPTGEGAIYQVGWSDPADFFSFTGNLTNAEPLLRRTISDGRYVLALADNSSPAWGAAGDGQHIGAWQGASIASFEHIKVTAPGGGPESLKQPEGTAWNAEVVYIDITPQCLGDSSPEIRWARRTQRCMCL